MRGAHDASRCRLQLQPKGRLGRQSKWAAAPPYASMPATELRLTMWPLQGGGGRGWLLGLVRSPGDMWRRRPLAQGCCASQVPLPTGVEHGRIGSCCPGAFNPPTPPHPPPAGHPMAPSDHLLRAIMPLTTSRVRMTTLLKFVSIIVSMSLWRGGGHGDAGLMPGGCLGKGAVIWQWAAVLRRTTGLLQPRV